MASTIGHPLGIHYCHKIIDSRLPMHPVPSLAGAQELVVICMELLFSTFLSLICWGSWLPTHEAKGVVWTILPCLCHLLSRIIVSNWLVLVPPATTKGIYHNDGANELYGQSSANTAPCRPFRLLLPGGGGVWRGGRLTGKLCSWIWAKGIPDLRVFCLTWGAGRELVMPLSRSVWGERCRQKEQGRLEGLHPSTLWWPFCST